MAAVGDETVVLGIRCQKNWVCMVHCLTANNKVHIRLSYGHPQQGLRSGAYEVISNDETLLGSSVSTLPVTIWANIKKNVSENIVCGHCTIQWYPVLFAQSFYALLELAACYAFWPEVPRLTKTKTGVWSVSSRLCTVFVMSACDNIYINNELVGSYTAKQWLGTGAQDSTFFELCVGLEKHARPTC